MLQMRVAAQTTRPPAAACVVSPPYIELRDTGWPLDPQTGFVRRRGQRDCSE
jgi:hypothetical protein